MENRKKVDYCGNGREIDGQYGTFFNLSLTEEDVKMIQGHLKNGWANLKMSKKKEPSKTGFTWSIFLSDFEPKKKEEKTDDLGW